MGVEGDIGVVLVFDSRQGTLKEGAAPVDHALGRLCSKGRRFVSIMRGEWTRNGIIPPQMRIECTRIHLKATRCRTEEGMTISEGTIR